jgi:acyl carrier protein
MTMENLKHEIEGLIREALSSECIDLNASFLEQAVQSFQTALVIASINDAYSIDVKLEAFRGAKTVSAFIDYVYGVVSAKSLLSDGPGDLEGKDVFTF